MQRNFGESNLVDLQRWQQQQMRAGTEVARVATAGGCKGHTRRQCMATMYIALSIFPLMLPSISAYALVLIAIGHLCISNRQSHFLHSVLNHNLTLATRHYLTISSTRALTILSLKVCFHTVNIQLIF